MKENIFVLSVGGSLIVPKEIDLDFLRDFRDLILKKVRERKRFIIMCGGGNINRVYNEAARKIAQISDRNLDWLGIQTTRLNAELMRVIFGDWAYEKVIVNPTKRAKRLQPLLAPSLTLGRARRLRLLFPLAPLGRAKTSKPIIIGAGFEPGVSTDYDTVLMAKNYGAKTLINLSNIDYVYTDDPKLKPNAKPIPRITWKDFKKIVGSKWKPRMNKPFDPIASKLAEKLKIRVIILNGKGIENLKNCLEGEDFKGTIIE